MVCNAGPLIALAKIDHLRILREVAEPVRIPEIVLHEVLGKPGKDSDRIQEATRTWLMAESMPDKIDPTVDWATRRLDAGERAVIAVAASYPSPVVALLDDAAGRQVARRLGLPVMGFAGILLLAKKRRMIESVVPLLEAARDNGYWISDELVDLVRKLASE